MLHFFLRSKVKNTKEKSRLLVLPMTWQQHTLKWNKLYSSHCYTPLLCRFATKHLVLLNLFSWHCSLIILSFNIVLSFPQAHTDDPSEITCSCNSLQCYFKPLLLVWFFTIQPTSICQDFICSYPYSVLSTCSSIYFLGCGAGQCFLHSA